MIKGAGRDDEEVKEELSDKKKECNGSCWKNKGRKILTAVLELSSHSMLIYH